HMARRLAQRGSSVSVRPSEAPEDDVPPHEQMRRLVQAAFQELDAGELSFSLAAPSTPSADAGTPWGAVELGAVVAARDACESSKAAAPREPAAPESAPPRPPVHEGHALTANAARVPTHRGQPTMLPAPDTLEGVAPAVAAAYAGPAVQATPPP